MSINRTKSSQKKKNKSRSDSPQDLLPAHSMLDMQMEAFFGKTSLEDEWPDDPEKKAKIFNNTTKKDFRLTHNLVAAPMMPMGGDIDNIVDVLKYFLNLAKHSNVAIMKALKMFFKSVRVMNKFIRLRKIQRQGYIDDAVKWWEEEELNQRKQMKQRVVAPNHRIHNQGSESQQLDELQRLHVPADVKLEAANLVYVRQRLAAAKERRDWRERVANREKLLEKLKKDYAAYSTLSEVQRENLKRARKDYLLVALRCPKERKGLVGHVNFDQFILARDEVMLRRSRLARREFLDAWEAEREIEKKKKKEFLRAASKRRDEEYLKKKERDEADLRREGSSASTLNGSKRSPTRTLAGSTSTQQSPRNNFHLAEFDLAETDENEVGSPIHAASTSTSSFATSKYASLRVRRQKSGGGHGNKNLRSATTSMTSSLSTTPRAAVQWSPSVQGVQGESKWSKGKRKLFAAIALSGEAWNPHAGVSAADHIRRTGSELSFSTGGASFSHGPTPRSTISPTPSVTVSPERRALMNDEELAAYYAERDAARRAEKVAKEERKIVEKVVAQRRFSQRPPLQSFIGAQKKAAQESGFSGGTMPYQPKESLVRIRASRNAPKHDESGGKKKQKHQQNTSSSMSKTGHLHGSEELTGAYNPHEISTLTSAMAKTKIAPAQAAVADMENSYQAKIAAGKEAHYQKVIQKKQEEARKARQERLQANSASAQQGGEQRPASSIVVTRQFARGTDRPRRVGSAATAGSTVQRARPAKQLTREDLKKQVAMLSNPLNASSQQENMDDGCDENDRSAVGVMEVHPSTAMVNMKAYVSHHRPKQQGLVFSAGQGKGDRAKSGSSRPSTSMGLFAGTATQRLNGGTKNNDRPASPVRPSSAAAHNRPSSAARDTEGVTVVSLDGQPLTDVAKALSTNTQKHLFGEKVTHGPHPSTTTLNSTAIAALEEEAQKMLTGNNSDTGGRTETGAVVTVPDNTTVPTTRPSSAAMMMNLRSIAKVRHEGKVQQSPREVMATSLVTSSTAPRPQSASRTTTRPATATVKSLSGVSYNTTILDQTPISFMNTSSSGSLMNNTTFVADVSGAGGVAAKAPVVEQTGDEPLLYDYHDVKEASARHNAALAIEAPERVQASFFSYNVKKKAMSALKVVAVGDVDVTAHMKK